MRKDAKVSDSNTFRKFCFASTAIAIAATGMIASSPAFAQEVTDETADEAKRFNTVKITARRKEETLASAPLSVVAFDAEALETRGVTSDADLQFLAPGLTIRQTQGNNSLTYSMRGQSADTFSGSASAVISYMNEVPLKSGSASSFFDLSSIQVVKGPQGTLFGRNTTGGAVLFTTEKADTEMYEGAFSAKFGNYSLREYQGMVNIPLIEDKLAIRGAFSSSQRDGYIRNVYMNYNHGDVDRQAFRLSATFTPNDTVTNETMLQYSKAGGTNTGASYTWSVYDLGQTNNGYALATDSAFLYSPLADVALGAGFWDTFIALSGAYAPGLVAYVDQQRADGAYITRHPYKADHDGEDWNFNNTTTIELTDTLTLKNVLGYTSSDVTSIQPQLGAPFATILTANLLTGNDGNQVDSESLTEEIQLQGESFDGKLDWITGFFYLDEETHTVFPQTYFYYQPLFAFNYATSDFIINDKSRAVYAQGTYHLTDKLGVTAGARYTWESFDLSQGPLSGFAGAADQSYDFEDPSWELGVEYQATNSIFTYLKTRGSFRAGGFNGTGLPITSFATSGGNLFDSEHVKDVEAGFKFDGDLGTMPVTFNVAAYKSWIEDVQRVEFPDPDGPAGPLTSIAMTINIPEAEVQGLEVDFTVQPTDWLLIGGSGAYTDAEFTEDTITLFQGTGYDKTFVFGPFANAPENTATLYADVFFPVPDVFGDVKLHAEVYNQSSMFFSNSSSSITPDTELPGYTLVNARLEFKDINGSPFSAAVFGKNLTDEEYFVGGMNLGGVLGHNAAVVGEPQMYGVELSFKYGE